MFRAILPHALAASLSACYSLSLRFVKRSLILFAFGGLVTLMMACPQKQTKQVDYDEAERGLRLAININEVAYNSWNKVYEGLGTLQREGKISEARWAAISAVDGVIVLSEADLIEGIDRAKRLLENWRQASVKVLSAESTEEVAQLRERELEARHNFNLSIAYLNAKSLKLRDSYAEAVILAEAVVKDGNPLPAEHINAIRQIIRMVDEEVAKATGKTGAGKTAWTTPNSPALSSVK